VEHFWDYSVLRTRGVWTESRRIMWSFSKMNQNWVRSSLVCCVIFIFITYYIKVARSLFRIASCNIISLKLDYSSVFIFIHDPVFRLIPRSDVSD